MSSQPLAARPISEVELVADGFKLVTLTFGINLYTNRSFYDCAPEVVATLDAFLERCPPATLNYYATETMRAHKPVTKRALNMLDTWFKPEAPRKHYVALELKSSNSPQDAPATKYEVWAYDAGGQAKIVSMALPAQLATDQTGEMLKFVQQLCDIFPFRCGLAGFSFECSRYDKQRSETHAWATTMRHPGIDIVRIPFDARAVGVDGIKGVNWLTLLDEDLVKQLGGVAALRKKLSREIELISSKHGVIVKAGSTPSIGDLNRGETLPLYREVYSLLMPQIEAAAKRSMAFQLVDNFVERTQAWYRRLGE